MNIASLLATTSIAALFAMSFLSVSFAATPQQVQWHFSLNESCKNISFCGADITETITGTANGLSSGTITFHETLKEGAIAGVGAFTDYATFKGTWTTGPGILAQKVFVVSGFETLTTKTSSGSKTVHVQLIKIPLDIPVKVAKLDCAQILYRAWPSGVRASETVTETIS